MDWHDKLAWGMKHLKALDREIDAFVKDNPFSARSEVDRKAKRIRILANRYPPLPPDWSLMVGDVVHSLRSSLDHIVWAHGTNRLLKK